MSLPVSTVTQQQQPISVRRPLSLGLGAVTALAPMQDVTDLGFMNVIAEYGCPDYFFTEYFRVHETSSRGVGWAMATARV